MAALIRQFTIAALLLALGATSQSCSNHLKASYPAPVVADGYNAQLIVAGLSKPRGLLFDSEGALLVVESGVGITHIVLRDDKVTCLGPSKTTRLIDDKQVISFLPIMETDFALNMANTTIPSLPMASSSPRTAKPSMPRHRPRYSAGPTTRLPHPLATNEA